ncbi:GNAT family acetyltransferase [Leucobacter sp. OLJS4]|uniref:GNAT family acetyltransferase n=1 Tax=unclassified Leucobacter TaxID=2621730 RepID=UPI000C19E643|nr:MULTISPECIES: GNAT family acetyltransferase [unclassified Leucobacter]PIJ13779.1 GNAT family acetyltransferase [Leucobacter sp. OLES1]PII87184.1 GNAT family acetyltransferase [Leucobacter sp. OLCALW19]PII87687.1 GNAT family acetyltransferase [Leucobacter sp. OLTLW20]PII90382.1 GNAT family acetyltransferase [Leucobacter sp. OLAS13]PII97416.1 GNAT family acetyltransferase [Leucobacter sp. OLDS2]
MDERIRTFAEPDTETVVALWEACELTRPWNDPRADIARKAAVQPELFLVAEHHASGRIVGSVMAGYDGHRGWLYYLATDPAHRGRGIARALVAEAERRLGAMGCPKVQLMVRVGNDRVLGFYDALGYGTDDVLVRSRRLIADS